MENQNNNKGVIALLIVIIVILATLCVLFATGTISFNLDDTNDNNTNENISDNNSNEDNDNSLTNEIDNEILGTYYLSNNNENNTYYFKLKADGMAEVVTSSCSDGPLPLKTVPYRVTIKDSSIILEIDINNDQQYSDQYVGNKNSKRFYPNTLGCNETPESYYIQR